MQTNNDIQKNKLYLSEYDEIKKFGWYARNFKAKIPKSDVFELIEKSNDLTLKQTVNYIYNIQGDLLPYDLINMQYQLNKVINKYYDDKLKNLNPSLSNDEIDAKNQSFLAIQKLIDKFYPKPE